MSKTDTYNNKTYSTVDTMFEMFVSQKQYLPKPALILYFDNFILIDDFIDISLWLLEYIGWI